MSTTTSTLTTQEADRVLDQEHRVHLRPSVASGDRPDAARAAFVPVPTLLHGVLGDSLTVSQDVEPMFAALPNDNKSFYWVEGTTARWDGHLEFQRRPGRVLDRFSTNTG